MYAGRELHDYRIQMCALSFYFLWHGRWRRLEKLPILQPATRGGDQMFWLHYWGSFTVSISMWVQCGWFSVCTIHEPPYHTSNCFIHCYITFVLIQAELYKNLFLICWKSVAEKLFAWTLYTIEECEDTHNEGVRKDASDVRYESRRLPDWRGDYVSASLSCKHIKKKENTTWQHPVN